jgi:predicted amino acid-binding ACT domain protein
MLTVSKTDLWAAPIDDQPGGVAAKLQNLVLKTNANLQFLWGERMSDQDASGVLFLLPIGGEQQEAVARQAGFVRNDRVACLRVTGDDEPGIAYRILRALADRGLNLRAVSAHAFRNEFVMYLALDTPAAAEAAAKELSIAI